MEHLIEHAGHVAMNTLLWEAAVVLWGNWYDGSWCQQTP